MSSNTSVVASWEARTIRQRIELPALPDHVVRQLHTQLGLQTTCDNRIDMELRLTARFYWEQAPEGSTTDRSARRKRMRVRWPRASHPLVAHMKR